MCISTCEIIKRHMGWQPCGATPSKKKQNLAGPKTIMLLDQKEPCVAHDIQWPPCLLSDHRCQQAPPLVQTSGQKAGRLPCDYPTKSNRHGAPLAAEVALEDTSLCNVALLSRQLSPTKPQHRQNLAMVHGKCSVMGHAQNPERRRVSTAAARHHFCNPRSESHMCQEHQISAWPQCWWRSGQCCGCPCQIDLTKTLLSQELSSARTCFLRHNIQQLDASSQTLKSLNWVPAPCDIEPPAHQANPDCTPTRALMVHLMWRTPLQHQAPLLRQNRPSVQAPQQQKRH